MKIIKMPVASLNPDDLNLYATRFTEKLVAHVADFPAPPLTDLTRDQGILNQRLGELSALLAEVGTKRSEVEDACVPVRADMNTLGDWCEGVTQDPNKLGNVAELRSGRTPSGPTPRVMGLALSTGDLPGEVDGGWDSLAKQGVKSYEIQTVLNPLNNDPSVGPWAAQPSVTKSKFALTGFTSGARIWVRVRGIGPAGAGPYSDPATIIVP